MKYIKYGVLALTLIFVVLSAWMSPKPKTESDFLLDTYVSVTVYEGPSDAAKVALLETERIHKTFSAYLLESEVAKINRAEKNTPVFVTEECISLLQKALELSFVTEGNFDLTIKPVMDLWSFSENPKVPEKAELSKVLPAVNYRNLSVDAENHTVTKEEDGMQIDLGGIAKGYASMRAAEVLLSSGVTSAVLDFGGNVVTIGERPLRLWDRIKNGTKTKPFIVGIQSPGETRGAMAETVTIGSSPCAVVTSGGYERNFTKNGQTYHHIINPKTGMQPENGILSVTVVSSDATTADALSTALFVSGPSGVSSVQGMYEEIIFIMENGEIKRWKKEK